MDRIIRGTRYGTVGQTHDPNGQRVAPPVPPPKLRMVHNALMAAIQNETRLRTWGRDGGGGLSPGGGGFGRDRWGALSDDLGYPSDIGIDLYQRAYARGGVASRVVNIWPDECWGAHPEICQTHKPVRTRFERRWEEVQKKTNAYHYMHRADRMSGVGTFGILLLGLPGEKLSDPVPGLDPITGERDETFQYSNDAPVELKYIRAFGEPIVKIASKEKNVFSPRYDQPTMYEVQFSQAGSGPGSESGGYPTYENHVHWTRCIHLADNRESSEINGVPRMRGVMDYLYDIRKVAGSSAEMFYKGGFPGYAFETYPDLAGEAVLDQDEVDEEIWRYTQGLQRYLTSVGGKWNSLAVQVASPKDHIEQYIQLICATIGIPVRIFTGAESGHLASQQDAANWKERVRGRQVNYLQPWVLEPFIDRLMAVGVLPWVKKYIVSWRDLRALSDKDRADVALKQTQALFQYVSGGVNQMVPEEMYFTEVLGFSDELARACIEQILKNPAKLMLPPAAQAALMMPAKTGVGGKSPKAQGGQRNGAANTGPVGRPKDGPPKDTSPSSTTPAGRRAAVHAK